MKINIGLLSTLGFNCDEKPSRQLFEVMIFPSSAGEFRTKTADCSISETPNEILFLITINLFLQSFFSLSIGAPALFSFASF